MLVSKKFLSLALLCGSSSFLALVQAQQSAAPPSREKREPNSQASTLVRNPYSGRLYRQAWVDVPVRSVEWKTKPVSQTVYQPQVVTRQVSTRQTVFVPQTNYVLQQRVRGRWNPFRQTTLTYEYRPVTTWVATTQTMTTPVTTQQWVPQQQTVYVSEPVQTTKMAKRLVQTEVPQPGVMLASQTASARQPLVRIPLLARQRVLPWPARPAVQTTNPRPIQSGLRQIVSNNAMSNLQSASYAAPLRTASNSRAFSRDAMQSGMAATVLR